MTDFEARFSVSIPGADADPPSTAWPADEPATALLRRHTGATFASGLYRMHDGRSSKEIESAISLAFPKFAGAWTPFGFDWLGRQFAFRREAKRDEAPVLMFEPGTGVALEVPANVWDFHQRQLVTDPEPALAVSFFRDWLGSGGRPLAHNEVAGYRVPLFLGGQDGLENLEVVDLDVYWTLMSQLIHQTRGLPPGTRIGSVESGDIPAP